jgi:type I restriction enzyme S subunit
MARDWTKVRIGDLGRVVTGRTPPGNDSAYYGGEVPFLTPSDMADRRRVEGTVRTLSPHGVERLSRCLVPEGVGVSCIGWQMGKAILIDRPTITNQQINSIIVRTEIADISFVYYSLLNRRMELFNLGAGGSRTPILNKGDFEQLPFDMPPLHEQRAIGRILGALDDKIELNRRMSISLDATARALFRSWFVDFEPVRARAAGDDLVLSSTLADVFPTAFAESALGSIPKGWRAATIADLAEIAGGSTPRTKEPSFWEDGTHFWATPKDLSSLAAPVLLETERKVTELGLSQIGSGLLPPGTVLLSSRAPIGYLAVTEVPVAINQGFIAMLPRLGVSHLFLLYWAEWAQQEILSRANGSTFLEISKSSFRPIPLVVPAPPAMSAFERMVQPLYLRVVNNERESRTLARLRDTLLPKLVSGDVRLEHAERFLGRST